MSDVIEEYVLKRTKEDQINAAKNMFKEGLSVELIARIFPSLSSEILLQLQKNISV